MPNTPPPGRGWRPLAVPLPHSNRRLPISLLSHRLLPSPGLALPQTCESMQLLCSSRWRTNLVLQGRRSGAVTQHVRMCCINAEPCKSATASTPSTWDRLPISHLSHRLLPSRARQSWQRGLSWCHACSASCVPYATVFSTGAPAASNNRAPIPRQQPILSTPGGVHPAYAWLWVRRLPHSASGSR